MRRISPTRLGPMVSLVLLLSFLPVGAGDAGGKKPPDRSPAPRGRTARADAQWMYPAEGTIWQQAEMRALFTFPQRLAGARLRIFLNDTEKTDAFSPFFSSGRQRQLGAAERPPWRAVGRLDIDDLRVGENRLVAVFEDETGSRHRWVRRFTFRPQGRLITARVVVDTKAGTADPTASARIVVVPVDGAPGATFRFWNGDAALALHPNPESRWALARGGVARFFLPSGRYRLIATRGPLDSIDEWTTPGSGEASHEFHLTRQVDIKNASTVDFHVHGAASRDSIVPLEERVWSFLAAGVDVFVASDHGHITDYRPVVHRLPAASARIKVISGLETGLGELVAARHRGHWNIWPLEPEVDLQAQYRGLAQRERVPGWDELAGAASPVALMFDLFRVRAGELARRAGRNRPAVDPPIIQLNHPRGLSTLEKPAGTVALRSWFNGVKFDPSVAIPPGEEVAGVVNSGMLAPSRLGTTPLDFDALEIWNRNSRRRYIQVRDDWFALLNQGHVRTAVANTDTHTLDRVLAGYPLNIVSLPPGHTAGVNVTTADLAAAVRAGRVTGTDGPVPHLQVRSGERVAGVGEMLTARDGSVTVEVDVQAAAWVPIGTVRVWSNGRIVASWKTDAAGRYAGSRHVTAGIELDGDAWLVAEVGDPDAIPDGTTMPGRYGLIVPRGMAVGFTNPVFVDVDGNARFDPPVRSRPVQAAASD